MENIFKNSNDKIWFTEPLEKIQRKVTNTKFGKSNVGFGLIFAAALTSNLFTWPLQVADMTARHINPDRFGPSKEFEESVETICEYFER